MTHQLSHLTLTTLRELDAASWFSRVGIPDFKTVLMLSNWTEAMQWCGMLEWENLRLEVCNQYREELLRRSESRLNLWNTIVQAARAEIQPRAEAWTAKVVKEHELPKRFVDDVRWDMLNLLMEAEYDDIMEPGFYTRLAFWYVKGHFPCGYEHYPPRADSRLVVF